MESVKRSGTKGDMKVANGITRSPVPPRCSPQRKEEGGEKNVSHNAKPLIGEAQQAPITQRQASGPDFVREVQYGRDLST